MSNDILHNPEEQQRLCQNIDRLLMQHLKMSDILVTTSQYSTQVNMDEQNKFINECIDKKKIKRKQYKRKKKEKKKQNQQSAKLCLSVIISQIYQGKTNFQERRKQVERSLNELIAGQKFHSFLNDAIKLYVKNIQKGIWDFMQTIISQNSLNKNSDDHQFYLQMIDHIYIQFCKLKASSLQIQKIINLFMCMNSNSNQHENDHYGLDRSTFKFMIESDQTIKNLLKLCHRRTLPKYTMHFERIRELTQFINHNIQDEFLSQDIENAATTQNSISVDDQQQQKITKRKKRKKLKDADFRCNEVQVTKRLDDMIIIKDTRTKCSVTQDWVDKLKQKYIPN